MTIDWRYRNFPLIRWRRNTNSILGGLRYGSVFTRNVFLTGSWLMLGRGFSIFITAPQSPLESPSTHNQHAPIPYDQLQHHGHHSVGSASPMSPPPVAGVPVLPTGPAPPMDGNKSLPHRSPHPLKSFSVPGPPPHTSAPDSPSQKLIGTGMVSWGWIKEAKCLFAFFVSFSFVSLCRARFVFYFAVPGSL